MNVGLLLCSDCFFSQRAQAQLTKVLESMVGIDREKLDLRLTVLDFKELGNGFKCSGFAKSQVQIVLISQHFLDRLKHDVKMKKNSPITGILKENPVIAVLLSVSTEEIIEGFNQYLPHISKWNCIPLKSSNTLDPEFYKKFQHSLVSIYQSQVVAPSLEFSLFPKKVTKGQPKVAILFKTEVKADHKVKVDLTRNARQREVVEDVMMANGYMGIIRIPASLFQEGTSLLEVTPYVNSEKMGTKQVKFEDGEECEDTITKMCTRLPGFRKLLDNHVAQQLSETFRAGADFSQQNALELMNELLTFKSDDFPTPVHFAAYYGLEQTVCVLLYEGDGVTMTLTKNTVGETAVDLAIQRGFTALAESIKEFSEMSNTFGALRIIKDLCDRHSDELDRLSKIDQSVPIGTSSGNQIVLVENPEYLAATSVVTINVETVPNDTIPKIIEPEQSHLSPPVPQYVNLLGGDTKAVILQTYDIPPPPVVIKKPPRKNKGTLQVQVPGYDVPRKDTNYFNIPRPVIPTKPASKPKPIPTSPVLSIKTPLATGPDGYMSVNTGMGEIVSSKVSLMKPGSEGTPEETKAELRYPIVLPPVIHLSGGLSQKGFLNGDKSPNPLTKQFSIDSTQDELVELMQAFKNNVYNLRELELLYENWKLRNDVVKDFKVRQKELREIQKEYRKIQVKVRRETKKSGAVAKLLKLIPGGKRQRHRDQKIFKRVKTVGISGRKKISGAGIEPGPQNISSPNLEDFKVPGPDEEEPPERKVSDTSTSGRSTLSENSILDGSGGVSDPDLSDKDKRVRLRERFDVGSYVPPTTNVTELSPQPPVRPPKKTSLDIPPPKPPLPRPYSNVSETGVQLVVGSEPEPEPTVSIPTVASSFTTEPITILVGDTTYNGGSAPPAPPPRPMKSDSPFSYINYEGKAKGLPGPQSFPLP